MKRNRLKIEVRFAEPAEFKVTPEKSADGEDCSDQRH
jgi:hypothetical protein